LRPPGYVTAPALLTTYRRSRRWLPVRRDHAARV